MLKRVHQMKKLKSDKLKERVLLKPVKKCLLVQIIKEIQRVMTS